MPEAKLYIDLLKQTVADTLHDRTWYVPVARPKHLIKRVLSDLLAAQGITLVREVDPGIRGEGSERPPSPNGTAWLDATSAFTLLILTATCMSQRLRR